MTKAIMIQGAGSNVGKSLIVAGLARAYKRRGISVAPFKPQNMSNNAAATPEGGEIGRAQALQARAAGLTPHTDMNPVLLKPETDTGAQVIVQGQRTATLKARDYGKHKQALLPKVLESFHRLADQHDLIIIEGAGSPAETNLRRGDIANMGFAEAADIPVILAGDIDRGGVIAQLVGTHAVLSDDDRNRIVAFMINKFRGDTSLFDEGLSTIATHTGWHSLGVLPWFEQARLLPAEDILDIRSTSGDGLTIAVPRLNRIANFDDLDPLAAEPGVDLRIIEPGHPLPGDAALVIIPGTKATIADLRAFRKNGWDIDLQAHLRRGGHVLGICGGYQMLGKTISDPDGIEGKPETVKGLGLLDVQTTMSPEKKVAPTKARHIATGTALEGYEIHIGTTMGPDCKRPWLETPDGPNGARSHDHRVSGTYLHGLFSSDDFRAEFLSDLGNFDRSTHYDATVEQTLDDLAHHLETNLDLNAILDLTGEI